MDDASRFHRLIDRYVSGRVDRRDFLAALGAAGVACGVVGGPMGFLARIAHAAGRIRYDGFGGTVDKAVTDFAIEPFVKRTGTQVDRGSYGGMDEFLTKVKASSPGEYNVFLCNDQFNYKRFSDLGYATELDESKIPNLKNCAPATVNLYRKLSPNARLSGVPYVYGVSVWAYNTKRVDGGSVEKAGVNALIDPKFKGKIGGDMNWANRIWYAALQAGQNPNDIHDMNAVWDRVRQSREVVLKYYTSGAEQMSLLANEEVWIADVWSGRVAVLQRQGHPLKTVVPPGARTYVGTMYVLKGSPMDAAQALLNAMLEPEAAIAVSKAMAYPTVLDPGKFKLPEEITSLAGFDPTGTFNSVTFEDPVYWTAHALDWQRQFQRIVTR
ncbi:MAG TPA: extracellular solute-binding protein [Candidatus Methylomirabilis sp.]|nr:extracellular solute-binding protein [Candidatus Methylomirabilis sp.]